MNKQWLTAILLRSIAHNAVDPEPLPAACILPHDANFDDLEAAENLILSKEN